MKTIELLYGDNVEYSGNVVFDNLLEIIEKHYEQIMILLDKLKE